jgi:hypothetical protein
MSRPEIAHVQAWLNGERAYAEGKWPTGHVDETITPDRYKEWVEQYMHRALVLGLDNPLGRQAQAKALRTLLAYTESVVRRFGPLPAAGVPSGELVESQP